MPCFIDTHAHLYDPVYGQQPEAMIAYARSQGIKKVYLPNLNLESIGPMLALEAQYPELCKPMLGLHPCDVKADFLEVLATMEAWLAKHAFIAIGEVGLDRYWDTTYYEAQVKALHTAIDWALHYELPLALHARNSMAALIHIIRQRQKGALKGVFHCFTGTVQEAREILDLNFLLGIGGMVTFPKKPLHDVLRALPLSSMVLETDAPYLAPVPYRGQTNQPGYIAVIAQAIAGIKGCSLEEVATITTRNAETLFGSK